MTTRFRDDDFLGSLMGTVHETGHGRYEQNLPREWLGQPVANARSMALHESQSLSFEMQLGSHPGFVARLAPLVERLAQGGVQLLVAGGLCYTLGLVFFAWKRRRYHHFIWHLFVLAGSVCHYFAILHSVIPAPASAAL